MGNFVSRQNAAVEEADQIPNNAYKYPPRMGNFFGTHFIMGGERFDTPQPESYLFGENADLNFLGNRPTAFPYPPPQANEPTKTLKSLVNIRKESVRFVRVPNDKKPDCVDAAASPIKEKPKPIEILDDLDKTNVTIEDVDGNVLCSMGLGGGSSDSVAPPPPCCYNIEFTFDSDAKCAITVYYFASEEVSPSGVTLVAREGLTSETYHFDKGINQSFSQPGHVFNPQVIPEDDFIYNSGREQYPVAIHCVVEEGNDECRQSHTTICVIDHHPETNSYVLRALKQKIFVDGLCYLLQEIYGIENKAVNKSSIDEDIDDHGSECVICMSETRDTLILPCRHLCLCNSCADSLRYQANNCPICRAPFRALLQIRAVQKGISTHVLHQNTPTSAGGDAAPVDVPPGYVPVSLIEALNGPPQYVARARTSEHDITDTAATVAASTMTSSDIKATSPVKSNSTRRPKIKKNASTCTSTSEVGTITTPQTVGGTSVVEIESDPKKTSATATSTTPTTLVQEEAKQDKLQIVNERKYPTARGAGTGTGSGGDASAGTDDDVDSENEKLSPLLSPGSKSRNRSNKSLKQVVACLEADDADKKGGSGSISGAGGDSGVASDETSSKKSGASLKRAKPRPELTSSSGGSGTAGSSAEPAADDSDYYTPEDTQNSILSPLCPTEKERERAKSGDPLCGGAGGGNASGGSRGGGVGGGTTPTSVVVGFSSAMKKNLHKKSTSVGNMVGSGSGAVVDLKSNNVSSLPDMLDSPISGNSASTRSSSDSYSSSSSTKQLLSSNPTTTAANIIVDDKTALQNAVNV
ncbi:E3 ubiquitin ligase Rnf157 [Drosophila pseudoobscura]|uniref:RING-type E3 ubiquitin transferase n=1 Tax=Drosophila pseudoobscura pseudoobscura TaxID=46245 RepID=A0A6I8UFA5_DROPS|nr:E3 ubiquitin ligase Rnf157 [Drosophila pseudoobscura]